MAFEITKQLRFEACHRLPGHNGKCRFLHGHSYRAFVTLRSHVLDEMDMVMDFADVRPLQEWIDKNFDHNTILARADPFLNIWGDLHPHCLEAVEKLPYVCEKLPTAEHLAFIIFEVAEVLLTGDTVNGPKVVRVVVFETESSCASYSKE